MPKEQPKPQLLGPKGTELNLDQEGVPMTLADALRVLNHLEGRKALCTNCGYRLVAEANMAHSHCKECVRDGMTYGANKPKVTDFDKRLAERLQAWAEAHVLS